MVKKDTMFNYTIQQSGDGRWIVIDLDTGSVVSTASSPERAINLALGGSATRFDSPLFSNDRAISIAASDAIDRLNRTVSQLGFAPDGQPIREFTTEVTLPPESPRNFAPAPVDNNVSVVWDSDSGAYGVWNNSTGTWIARGLTQEEATELAQDFFTTSDLEALVPRSGTATLSTPEGQAAAQQAAAQQSTINQATLQSRYNQPGTPDWRVRLQLAPGSDYLYNAAPAGILAPLAVTNGVLFPYLPQIITGYKSNYENYSLIHSNFRGVYYKNSQVDDVQIRGIFTAQDTREAQYLLAVIHFFRSVTKMFYGKDAERGTPPPLVYLSGFGDYQFSKHPCVVSQFNYQLPDNVDYIRATNPNNYGENLLNRRTPIRSSFGGSNFAGALRRANALLPQGAISKPPAPGSVPQSVNNTQRSTYVPTRMEMDIVLIPLQSREQISKQFSLKGFANGDLIKGGYW
jgi:hypothetical protein